MKTLLIAAFPVALLAACADAPSGAAYRPILDGPASAAFQTDLNACQSIARNNGQLDSEMRSSVVAGATLGAVAGWADGDLDTTGEVLGTAAVGGVFGAAEGLVSRDARREDLIRACMRGRGHKVIG